MKKRLVKESADTARIIIDVMAVVIVIVLEVVAIIIGSRSDSGKLKY